LLSPDDVVLKARVVGAMARLDHMTGRHGGARELLEQALAGVDKPSAGSTALRLELTLDHWFADEWNETVTLAKAAAADAKSVRDSLSYATAVGLEAVGRSYLGELEHATALADEAAGIIDRLPDNELAVRIEALVVLSHAEFGGIERAFDSARHSDRGIAVSRATGQDSWYALLMSERCVANLLLGRLAEAREAADRALDSARLGHYQPQIWALLLRCWVDVLAGDVAQGIAHGEEAVAIVERTDTGLFNWLAYGCLAVALIHAGEPARARDLILENAGGPELDLVERGWLPHWYENLTLAELGAGDLDAARHWAERSQAAADAFPTPGRLGEAAYARAALELAAGRPGAAVPLALSATDGFTAAEWPIDAARARILAARGLRASEPERAVKLLQRAHAELDACGALGYRNEAAYELRALGERAPREGRLDAASALDPQTLTARERDVAELVARGMSNRQIADELFVSPKTVESHMTRILRKAGLPSRAALTVAVERWRREQRR
jgi:DNA-binding CsgD family transcriptional regulator